MSHRRFVNVEQAQTSWFENSLFSVDGQHRYFDSNNPWRDPERYFLDPSNFPERWSLLGGGTFRIFETGFGAALNFVATAQLWKQLKPNGKLHYYALENRPLPLVVLKRILSCLEVEHTLIDALVIQYPPIQPGVYPLRITENIDLTLIYLESGYAFKQLGLPAGFCFDNWFLGDSADNPDDHLPSNAVMHFIASHSRPGSQVCSKFSTSQFNNLLTHYGFNPIEKSSDNTQRDSQPPGTVARFTAKSLSRLRKPLAHEFTGAPITAGPIAIIGAGLAGASLAWYASRAGLDCQLFESAAEPASGASSMPLMLSTPHLSTDHNRLSQLTWRGHWQLSGLLQQLSIQPKSKSLLQGVTDELRATMLADYAEVYTPTLADAAIGMVTINADNPLGKTALKVPGLCVDPNEFCRGLLAPLAERNKHFGHEVYRLELSSDGWLIESVSNGKQHHAGPFARVIVASGFAQRWCDMLPPTEPLAGQLSVIDCPEDWQQRETPIQKNTQAMPWRDQSGNLRLLIGATFHKGVRCGYNARDSDVNLKAFNKEFGCNARLNESGLDLQQLAGVRATTNDRLPLVGPVPNQPGLWLSYGFGTRGLTLAPLAANLIVSSLTGQCLPIPRYLAAAISPHRLAIGSY